jgi:hypothetical protein
MTEMTTEGLDAAVDARQEASALQPLILTG